jgi:hypothetical protein
MILWLEEGPIKAAPRPSRPRHGRTYSAEEDDQLRLDLSREMRPQCGFDHDVLAEGLLRRVGFFRVL